MEEKRTRRLLVAIVASAVLLPVLYLGSYFALLSDRGIFEEDATGRMHRVPYYETEIPFAGEFLRPAHWIDRCVRPDHWRWYEPNETFPF